MVSRLFHSFRTNLVTGTLTLAPLAAVLWIVAWLWQALNSVRDVLPESWHPAQLFNITNGLAIAVVDTITTITLVSFLVIFVAIVGMTSRHILGQRLFGYVHQFIDRIPVLRTVYSTLEQLVETFGSQSSSKNFRRVVLIEYPRKGIYCLALVTGERKSLLGIAASSEQSYLDVFVPTTPNPTSGFYLTVQASEAKEVNLSVEEALKQIISMGMVKPSHSSTSSGAIQSSHVDGSQA